MPTSKSHPFSPVLKEAPVSEPYQPLSKNLARIEELCVLLGKRSKEVLDVQRLSHTSGVTTLDVQTLLAGNVPPEDDPDVMVRRRVRFLYEAYTGDDGQPRDIRDIATAIKQTTTWTKKLVHGEAKPNIHVGSALCKLYGVDNGFLTDSPAEALNRELRPILIDLEVEADPEQALKTLGVVHISGRNPSQLQHTELTALAKMVAQMSNQLDGVKDRLERMGYTEEDR
jgi:hypothetical protein